MIHGLPHQDRRHRSAGSPPPPEPGWGLGTESVSRLNRTATPGCSHAGSVDAPLHAARCDRRWLVRHPATIQPGPSLPTQQAPLVHAVMAGWVMAKMSGRGRPRAAGMSTVDRFLHQHRGRGTPHQRPRWPAPARAPPSLPATSSLADRNAGAALSTAHRDFFQENPIRTARYPLSPFAPPRARRPPSPPRWWAPCRNSHRR